MSTGVIELRTYKLVDGTRELFDAIFQTETLPVLLSHGVDVLGTAMSLVDDTHYLLVRAFPSIESRERQNEEFYGSPEWTEQLEARVMKCIESYHTVVLDDSPELREHLRMALSSTSA